MRKLLFLLGLLACGLAPSTTNASLQLIVDSATFAQSPSVATNGFVDAYFHILQPDSSNPLAGYQIKVKLTPVGSASGMTITGTANPSAPHPAVFPSTPPSDSSTATFAQATAFLNSGANSIAEQAGLIQINYALAPGARGIFNLTIDATNTFLADANSNPIAYTPVNGTVSVAPEPSSLCVLGSVVAFPLLRRRRR